MLDTPQESGVLRRRRLIVGLLALSVVLLVVIILFLWLRDCCGANRVLAAFEGSSGRLVLFEPRDDVGPHPFMSLTDRSEITGDPASPVVPGVGIYGGSLENTCDPELMIAYLLAHPDKGQAWAAVQGIAFADLPAFIRSLTPFVLLVDTLVLNHGFSNGTATPRPSILEAGTAVLVDAQGVPRARCYCGNPLDIIDEEEEECTVTATALVYADWQDIGSAYIAKVEPGDPIVVLEFAENDDGVLGAKVKLPDGTVGWISAALLSDECDCTVTEPITVVSGWGVEGETAVTVVGPGDIVTVVDFAVDDYLGFGVEVELADGTHGWVAAESLTGNVAVVGSGGPLTKTAVTPGPVASGDTVDWVLTYRDEHLAPGATIVDVFGPGNTYVPGSAQGPAGWVIDDTAAGQVTWTYHGGTPPPTSVTSTLVNNTVPTITTPSGLDGYYPIYWNNRLFFTHHHAKESDPAFACYDLSTGLPCSGFPKVLPDGDPNDPRTVPVGHVPEDVSVIGDKLYYPATHVDSAGIPVDWGLGCYDLASDSECGFRLLGDNTVGLPFTHSYGAVAGPWIIGGNAYLFDQRAALHCVAIPALTLCGGPYPANLSGLLAPEPKALYDGPDSSFRALNDLSGQVDAGRLYMATRQQILCVMPTAGAWSACPGWSSGGVYLRLSAPAPWGVAGFVTPYSQANMGLFLVRDSSMTATYVCRSFVSNPASPGCLDVAAPSLPVFPPAHDALTDNRQFGLGREVSIGSKTYVPWLFVRLNPNQSNAAVLDIVTCWDWTSAGPCAGFGDANGRIQGVTPGGQPINGETYGLGIQDEGCIWVYGNLGRAWNFNPVDGSQPCAASGSASYSAVGSLTPVPVFSCRSGGVGWLWDSFTFSGVNPAEWSALDVAFTDGNGVVVFTADLLTSNGSVDLSSLGSTLPTLTYTVTGTPTPGVVPGTVTLELSYQSTGAALEFCVQTVVKVVSCHNTLTVLDGAIAYPFGPEHADGVATAIAGIGVKPTIPVEGCHPCDEDLPDQPGSTSTSLGSSTSTSIESSTSTSPGTSSTTVAGTITVERGEFCVIDTAADDQLNVRSGPGVGFTIIGGLTFNAVGVVNTGLAATDSNGGIWYEIEFSGSTGWVASWFLTPVPCGPAEDPGTFGYVTDAKPTDGGYLISFDVAVWNPDGTCGDGGDCVSNPDPATTEHFVPSGVPIISLLVWEPGGNFTDQVFTIEDVVAYEFGAGYDPSLHFSPPGLLGYFLQFDNNSDVTGGHQQYQP